MKKYCLILFFITSFNLLKPVFSQTSFYNLNTIQKIELFFSQSNWDFKLDSLKAIDGGYLLADSIIINDTTLQNVGVKYKGSSSCDPSFAKNPFHISIDEFQNQIYQDYTDIKLSNGYQDPSGIREVLSYNILKNYMFCPKANFARVYVNNTYIGLYSNIEDVTKTFCSRNFYSLKSNTFIKCNPASTPGPQVKSNLKYISADSAAYADFYELKSDFGWNELVGLCYAITNNQLTVASYIDMDRVIWMLAFDNLLVNLDSYFGAFAQNYYLFKDNNGIFNPVLWDLNMSFGSFPFAGSSNSSMGTLSIANMQNFSVNFHENDPYWPLINIVMQNDMYKRKYIAHMKTIVNEMFTSSTYINLANQMQTMIDSAVFTDTNKFFSYAQFQSALTTDISLGNYSTPGISNLMSARVNYLQALTEFVASPPAISNINSIYSNTLSTAYITASVTNANSNGVYLGFRLNTFKKFEQLMMYDDGNHYDGAAGDNVFGIAVQTDLDSSQFYIYAENSDAALFAPERAEHEFYNLIDYNTAIKNIENASENFNVVLNHSMLNISLNAPASQVVQIMDISGKIIYNEKKTFPATIDVTTFRNGVYLVRIGNKTERVVILK